MNSFCTFLLQVARVQGDPIARVFLSVDGLQKCFASYSPEINLRFAPSVTEERADWLFEVRGMALALPNETSDPPPVAVSSTFTIGEQEYLVSHPLETEGDAFTFFTNNTRWINPIAFLIDGEICSSGDVFLLGAVVLAYDDEGFIVGMLPDPMQLRALPPGSGVRDFERERTESRDLSG